MIKIIVKSLDKKPLKKSASSAGTVKQTKKAVKKTAESSVRLPARQVKKPIKKLIEKPIRKSVKKITSKKEPLLELKPEKKTEISYGAKPITKAEASYRAEDIYVLEGLEPVRRRPGMYIGSTGPDGLHHLIWECVDNSLDEAMAGFCKNIEVSLLPGNKIKTVDDGRGIPVEKHPQTKKSALETVMTTLHAGAKFGGKSYQVAGGLHGVGVSVVCALSKWMRAEVCRGGIKYFQEYSRGKPTTKVKKIDHCKKTGTTVIFEPDPEIFKEIKFDLKRILNHLRQQAYLTKGIKITVFDERTPEKSQYSFYFEGGLISYIKYLVREQNPRHQNIFYTQGEKEGILVEAAFQYTEEMECYEESFANNINTGEGGMHLTGFRTALTRTFNDYARKNSFLKETDENLNGEDVREGLTGVISVKLKEPQFEGQTKARLGNPEAKVAVEAVVSEGLADFLERNPQDARAIIENCILAAKARKAAKAARETVLRKGILEGLALPGKLADCVSRKPEESELYIVEGESAGGSSRQARDRRFQAILPLRGKILNVERARLDKILSSKEIKSLIIALGTAIADDFDVSKCRYHRIIIMCDADSDGNHIRTLLLTLFYRYFKPLIEAGYLYIAQPPLYRIQIGKNIEYAYTEDDKMKILSSIKKRKTSLVKVSAVKELLEDDEEKVSGVVIQRYKGLGEMNPEQLWETTMNPQNRVLKQVTIEDAKEADRIFDILMGEEVLPRKHFIQTHAKKVKNLDI
jgi:DNA gyrase subunit B